MKTIKIICFFVIIVILYLIYKFKYTQESFQCKRHKEFQVVFHTFDWQPKVDGVTLLNYVNEDYLNKMVINVLNNIWEPIGVSWNLLEIRKENILKTLQIKLAI